MRGRAGVPTNLYLENVRYNYPSEGILGSSSEEVSERSSENNNFFFKNQNFIYLFKQLKAVNAVSVQN